MVVYILNCTVEREILQPMVFETLADAQLEMERQYRESVMENDSCMLSNVEAYGENLNHDNIDWKIFETKI